MNRSTLLIFALVGLLMASCSVSALGVQADTGFVRQGTDAGQSGIRGLEFVMNSTSMLLVNATVDSFTTMELARLCSDKDCNTIIATSTSKVGNTYFWSTPPTLSAFGTYYILTTTATSASVSFTNAPPAYPVKTQYLNFTRSDTTGTLGTANMWAFTSLGMNTIGAAVNLTNPANNSGFLSLTGVTFNATLIPDSQVLGATNATFYLYSSAGALLSTNFTTSVASNKSNFTVGGLLSDGQYKWNIRYGMTDGTSSFAPANFTFSLDSTAPTVNGGVPANNTYIYSSNSTFTQFLMNITGTDSVGISYVWYNSTWNSTLTFVQNAALTMVNLTNVYGKHEIYRFANDSAGNMAMNETTIWIHRNIFLNESAETSLVNITLELWNQTAAPTLAVLNYSGVNYTGTITSLGNGKYGLNASFDMDTGIGYKNFSWFLSADQGFTRSNSLSQYTTPAILVLCNATINNAYMNVSFKNESTPQANANGSLDSLWSYWLGTGSKFKLYNFVNTTVNPSYAFCFTPRASTIYGNVSMSYQGSGFPLRSYQNSTVILSNITTNLTLYMLDSSSGQFVTFQVINVAEQALSGVNVVVTKTIGGVQIPVTSGVTGSDGGVTFFLDPLSSYTFILNKEGYTQFTTSLTPSQTSYTFTIGQEAQTQSDYLKGIITSIKPKVGTVLGNGTYYAFNYTINSSFWALDEFGFTLRNASYFVLGTNSSGVDSGGTLSSLINTGNQSRIYMDYYWIINGSVQNATVSWMIFDLSSGQGSVAQFFSDLSLYIGTGFFGLDDFGVPLACFAFIFIFVGVMSNKYGFNSPAALTSLIFALVLFFDVGLGLIPSPPGVPANIPFPTVFVGIVLIAVLLREQGR